jgi:glutathione peroxidase
MKLTSFIHLFLFLCIGTAGTAQTSMSNSIHSFTVNSLEGEPIPLSNYKGKMILVVNTASKCGYTPQFAGLQELYSKYQDKLVIIGFPCNQFMSQDPGSATEIKEFCEKNYGVSFPMAEKIDVKGDNMAPIYAWLTQKEKNGVLDAKIAWNFNKFLIDGDGKLVAYFPSSVKPLSEDILKYINK